MLKILLVASDELDPLMEVGVFLGGSSEGELMVFT